MFTIKLKDGSEITASREAFIVKPHVIYVQLGARRVPLARADIEPIPVELDRGNTYVS